MLFSDWTRDVSNRVERIGYRVTNRDGELHIEVQGNVNLLVSRDQEELTVLLQVWDATGGLDDERKLAVVGSTFAACAFIRGWFEEAAFAEAEFEAQEASIYGKV